MNSEHTTIQGRRNRPDPVVDAVVSGSEPLNVPIHHDLPVDIGDDPEFRRRFAGGDASTIKAIHDTYAHRMYAVAHHVLGDHHLAADAVQQALLQAWRAASSFDPRRPLVPWLYTITRRAAIDMYRKHTDRNRVHPYEAQHLDSAVPHDDEAPWLTWQIRTALDALPITDQQLIQLAYYHHFTHNEIAAHLGIPVGTVKSRLHRAQRKLQSVLQHLAPTAT
ncbi:RNA polymerase sigma factor [Actinokineospora sp. 24-640]